MRTRTDYDEIAAYTPDRRDIGYTRPFADGGLARTVLCPICRGLMGLHASMRGPEGRCPECTVIVRQTADGGLLACGWMGGGDMRRAGAALREMRSRLEPPPTAAEAEGLTCGDMQGDMVGVGRHRRAKEKPCDLCREAYRLYKQRLRDEARQARAERLAREAAA